MASYKEKNFIADEKPQKIRPGKRTSPGSEYVKNLGSSRERVEDWQDKGLDRRAAFASTAIDEIIDEIKKTDDPERLEELGDAMRDVQVNGENSKWIKDRKRDYYGREPDPDEYIPEEEGAEETDPFTNEGNEIVNDKALDAIKDNFTPPGAKGEKKMNKRMFAPDMLCPKCKEPMLYQAGGGRIKCSKCGNEVGEDTLDSLELYKSPNIEESEQLKDIIDTNDNGKIEVDEMADFQKSLDDYASKNKKGRDDIPVTTRR